MQIENAVVMLPAVAGRPGAAYFTLEANRAGTRLQRVSSPRAGRAELHHAGMRPSSGIELPAGEPVEFEPGGRHVMLFDLDPSLRPGDSVALQFAFAGATALIAEAEARAPGDLRPGR